MITNEQNSGVRTQSRTLYCPNCANSLVEPGSFVNEYWMSSDTVYFCWCSECGFRCEIAEVSRIIATEPSEE